MARNENISGFSALIECDCKQFIWCQLFDCVKRQYASDKGHVLHQYYSVSSLYFKAVVTLNFIYWLLKSLHILKETVAVFLLVVGKVFGFFFVSFKYVIYMLILKSFARSNYFHSVFCCCSGMSRIDEWRLFVFSMFYRRLCAQT